jgi:hypothetical protein
MYLHSGSERRLPHQGSTAGTFRITQGGEIVGETRIRRVTASHVAPLVNGSFTPFPAYEHLRPFFQRLFESSGEQRKIFYDQFDTLGLQLMTVDGRVIPTDWIEIGDASAELEGEGAYQALFPLPPGFFDEDSYSVDGWHERGRCFIARRRYMGPTAGILLHEELSSQQLAALDQWLHSLRSSDRCRSCWAVR